MTHSITPILNYFKRIWGMKLQRLEPPRLDFTGALGYTSKESSGMRLKKAKIAKEGKYYHLTQ
jgi:hypothetical protein